ncbi:MAG: sulfotransferase domain-containing protein, partial [Anaerolineae bacterium]|nr:sulfotransferase domain-containing protein [Anaerolineae bacterium]
MLIYLSSYPRSGNTWMRHLLRHYFDQRATSIYPEGEESTNLIQNEDGSFDPYFSEYKSQYFPSITRRRLVNGCIPLLTEEFRSQMGASDEYFFLKTHELPYDRYFEGEYVLHLVRHPAAVLWSYYNFLRDFEATIAPNVTMEDTIKGQTPFGSWSAYNEQWLECGQALGDRFWLYSYEKLVSGEGEFCKILSSMTDLPIYQEIGSFPSFDHWH